MALVNHERKFIFLMEPHTASRAVVAATQAQIPGTSQVGHHHISMDHLLDWRRQHLDPKMVKDYRIIATVRNPFETLVTRYRSQANWNDKSIDEFVTTGWETSQAATSYGLHESATHFVWYEDIQDDLRWLFTQPDFDLGYDESHKTPNKKYWVDYFQTETIEKLLGRPDWMSYLQKYGYGVYMDAMVGYRIKIVNSIRASLCRPL